MALSPQIDRSLVQWLGLFAGPVLALVCAAGLPSSYLGTEGEVVAVTAAGRATVAVLVWMAVWWLTEAIDIFATALLPVAVFPLVGAADVQAAAAPYASQLIFLFMGGFLIALAMQRWRLDQRVALRTLRLVGTRPARMVGGFMLATAFLSAFVSNTATAAMMLPIALSVIDLVTGREREEGDAPRGRLPSDEGYNFGLCLMLGIAYAASIGGIATIIGTPPNGILVQFIADRIAEPYRQEIGFARWLLVGGPLAAVFLPLAWLLLTRVLHPIRIERIEGGRELIEERLRRLGPPGRGERAVAVVFALTAAAWILRPLLTRIEVAGLRPLAGLSDAGIAMLAGLSLFVIPVEVRERRFVLDWHTARKLPWGILILFGGGLSLAAAIQANGVAELIGAQVMTLRGAPPLLLIVAVATLVIFLTELTSNTATTATLVPILAGIAVGLELHPLLLIVPAAIAASCAFMMPIATPPNAIVFGSGLVSIPQMCRAGFWLNLLGVVLVTLLMYAVAIPLLGIAGG
jgi:sodium-dependent dicarboxylate transporter 2/3/5